MSPSTANAAGPPMTSLGPEAAIVSPPKLEVLEPAGQPKGPAEQARIVVITNAQNAGQDSHTILVELAAPNTNSAGIRPEDFSQPSTTVEAVGTNSPDYGNASEPASTKDAQKAQAPNIKDASDDGSEPSTSEPDAAAQAAEPEAQNPQDADAQTEATTQAPQESPEGKHFAEVNRQLENASRILLELRNQNFLLTTFARGLENAPIANQFRREVLQFVVNQINISNLPDNLKPIHQELQASLKSLFPEGAVQNVSPLDQFLNDHRSDLDELGLTDEKVKDHLYNLFLGNTDSLRELSEVMKDKPEFLEKFTKAINDGKPLPSPKTPEEILTSAHLDTTPENIQAVNDILSRRQAEQTEATTPVQPGTESLTPAQERMNKLKQNTSTLLVLGLMVAPGIIQSIAGDEQRQTH